MIFDIFFEIGLLVLGFLYVANMWFDSFIHASEVSRDIDEKEKEEREDKEREELCKNLYSWKSRVKNFDFWKFWKTKTKFSKNRFFILS